MYIWNFGVSLFAMVLLSILVGYFVFNDSNPSYLSLATSNCWITNVIDGCAMSVNNFDNSNFVVYWTLVSNFPTLDVILTGFFGK